MGRLYTFGARLNRDGGHLKGGRVETALFRRPLQFLSHSRYAIIRR
ncbi:hypothetical protein NEIMUCOT_03920 [Neisseria mucosa ATCC 25996]|uniref:Uncharacterized protein n=1 Tax=Neisseria mucosa (strain ATCC 25996 / DSM 4631 / NCTC 10774 / M26) TaxID=546266 RepID=D2ZTI4_NEIM2|nr:hypothetical protein NEIMUCOT_03920 [Neisseria mucosa ATCC 25996]